MRKYSKLLFLFIFLCALMYTPVISQAAPQEPSPTGWAYENGAYTFYYVKDGSIGKFKNGIIELNQTIEIQDSEETITTFLPGLYYFSAGKLSLDAGSIGSFPVYRYRSDHTLQQMNKSWYRIDRKAIQIERTDSSTMLTPKAFYFTGYTNAKVFLKGLPYTGFAVKNDVFYHVKDGSLGSKLTGIVNKPYVDTTLKRLSNANNKCYKKGLPFTGIYKNRYYKQGAANNFTGWMKIEKNIYYLKNGTAVTGNCRLKSYGGGTTTYSYSFRSDGTLITDLFANSKTNYKNKRLKIQVNITTHTITILAYNSQTSAYDIPLKAFICSTSRTDSGTKTGNFHLNRNGRKRWFSPAIAKGKRHYQWATHIYGSGALFHSEVYRSLNAKNFDASSYNALGTNQSTTCIRMQAVNAKLIYDIAAAHSASRSVSVQIFRSANKGAFGQVKLSDTTGKIPTNMKYDPTDPTVKK